MKRSIGTHAAIPKIEPSLFRPVFERYCELLDTLPAKEHADDADLFAAVLYVMIELEEEHGEDMAAGFALRSTYLLRAMRSSEAMRKIASDDTPAVQAAINETVCTMPMSGKTNSRRLLQRLTSLGFKPQE